MEKKTILLTGGGTAGHVTPNIALIPKLKEKGFSVHYIGTENSIEQKLVSECDGVYYHSISSGKLRRYFSLKNFTDPFRVVKGLFQAKKIIKTIKPDVVFSKGGFVSVPVVVAARKRAPIITHESDYSPGLANKINARFATKVCVTFEDTLKYVGEKGIHTGTPVRAVLFEGNREKGVEITSLGSQKPVVLVMGGSLGALAVNNAVREALDELLKTFDIIHLCGKGKVDESINKKGYVQYEYAGDELPHLFAMTDIVVSRAGANAVFEFLALKKPSVLIPLPKSTSRGDQLLNASYFERKGYAVQIEQEKINAQLLTKTVQELYKNRESYIKKMEKDSPGDGVDAVLSVIMSVVGDKK
ncbi:MAG: undecaprenyldiphospho-muramoylpentapeptide beta-N-acetylglucosaminyltransferase [Clostridia bacterium]|nr:undecaprenyldiphospho-muramoylpentapeptide beta-N-acetylglucosaminyltransferase [Clostridia bacterium]